MSKLTPKQERFIDEYLIDLNATQAAIRAGYSENTANRAGSRLLSNVDIQEIIQNRKTKLAEENKFTQGKAREMLLEAFEIAKCGSNPSSMVSAVTSLCKLYGLNEADKHELKNVGAAPVTIIEETIVSEILKKA